MKRFRGWVVGLSAVVLLGCVRQADAPRDEPVDGPRALEFAFGQGDDQVTARSLRGRATVVALVTTYDLRSQLMLRRVQSVIASRRPRANALGVLLEGPKYAVLVPTFRETLGLSFPVVIADHATLTGSGPFGSVDAIPVMIVLDREGREVWRHVGVVTERELAAGLGRAGPP